MLWVHCTQKNRLNEAVLLSTPKHMFYLIDKIIITILRTLFICTYVHIPTMLDRVSKNCTIPDQVAYRAVRTDLNYVPFSP